MKDRRCFPELLHELTQMGYTVSFGQDFTGMIRLIYTYKYKKDFYYHEHIGVPDQAIEDLGDGIKLSLIKMINEDPAGLRQDGN